MVANHWNNDVSYDQSAQQMNPHRGDLSAKDDQTQNEEMEMEMETKE